MISSYLRRLTRRLRPKLSREVVQPPEECFPASLVDSLESSGIVDLEFYQHRYDDIRGFPGGARHHLLKHGIRELREISSDFSIARYLDLHRTPLSADAPGIFDALSRYDAEELRERFAPQDDASLAYRLVGAGLFDERWYLDRNDDVRRSGLDPLEHFIERGSYELRDPGPGFDSAFYRDAYRDYRLFGRTPIESYIRHGRRARRLALGSPAYARWLSRFDDLTAGDRERLAKAADRTSVVAILVAAGAGLEGVSAFAEQIGRVPIRIVRAAALSDEAWAAILPGLADRPGVSVRTAQSALDSLADGTAILLADACCRPRPHAAIVLADALRHAGASAAYSDHDHQGADSARSGPVFKPAMSPRFLERVSYPGPLVAVTLDGVASRGEIAAALEAAANGISPDAAWSRMLLRHDPAKVARVPFVLFSRPDAAAAGRPALLEPVPDVGTPPMPVAVFHRDGPSVAIVIPTRDHGDLVRDCVDSIERLTRYPRDRITIVIVDNGTVDRDTLDLLADYAARPGFTIVPYPGDFNFSAICNAGAAATDADILVFLNNDTTVKEPDWLGRLVEEAIRPETGLVGAQLLYPDGTVQHGGVALGVQGLGAHRLLGWSAEDAAAIDATREMTSVTGACLAVRRFVFEELRGFDRVLRVAFNDVDLCARAAEAGYRNIYVGEALLFHHESKSRGHDVTLIEQRRNAREAIYTRSRHADVFRDDPSYSPNLSLQTVGALAFPPRAVRPWRRSPTGVRRILLLSIVHGLGHGVAVVLAQQAAFLRERGWEVFVGGPPAKRETDYPGCRRVHVWDPDDAAAFAVAEGIDCVVAHTPPFFSIVRHLGTSPPVYAIDHGEPTPNLFPDVCEREDVDWEKRFCAPLMRRVFAISRSVQAHQYRADAIVIRNGNSHLASWSETLSARRAEWRRKFGFEGRFIVLNVCRFTAGERHYKGIDHYGAIASDLPYRHPEAAGTVRFVLVGRGDEEDVAYAESLGLTVFANVTDAEMVELYVAADLYMNLSLWEGYNLGIGQAMAIGLDVVASDIEAHREFGIETSSSIPELCDAVVRRAGAHDERAPQRRAVVQPWSEPLGRFAETIEADLSAADDVWRI